jgi:hypothetical protein
MTLDCQGLSPPGHLPWPKHTMLWGAGHPQVSCLCLMVFGTVFEWETNAYKGVRTSMVPRPHPGMWVARAFSLQVYNTMADSQSLTGASVYAG